MRWQLLVKTSFFKWHEIITIKIAPALTSLHDR